ncbi:MAG TPA: DUF2127 domain-containing protein [Gemmatimonadales bacterium]|nr:DUF2127 domain-containing protein [Gemmatimonadales bacterium]
MPVALAPAGAQRVGEALVRHLHLNPARRIPRIFFEALTHVSDTRLHWLAAGAAVYAIVRFIEAYGLWHGRRWAELFGVATGAIYVPAELIELWRHATLLSVAVLSVNVAVVVLLWQEYRAGVVPVEERRERE